MLNLRDLRIDPASLGRKMLLVDVMPAYEYKDGKRTETVSGYRYVVCLAEHRLEKLSVRIDGPQLMEKPEGFVDVIIDRAQKFNPDYVSPRVPVAVFCSTAARHTRHTGLTTPQALQAFIPNRI
jgi:hypothetical protein